MDNDFRFVARRLVPTDAHVLRGCLVAAGIRAVVTGDQHTQANLLLAPAIGGARGLIPEANLVLDREILAAFDSGDFGLQDEAE